jgi:hypothetical protein
MRGQRRQKALETRRQREGAGNVRELSLPAHPATPGGTRRPRELSALSQKVSLLIMRLPASLTRGSQVRSPSPPPSSPTQPQISRPSQNRPFLQGFSPVSFGSFESPVTLPVSQAEFSLPSPHPKIPFPAVGLRPPRPSGNSGILGAFWAKRTFRARSLIIAGSIRGLRTVGSILPGHHEVVRRRRRVANDLRQRRARDLVQGTRVRSSC